MAAAAAVHHQQQQQQQQQQPASASVPVFNGAAARGNQHTALCRTGGS